MNICFALQKKRRVKRGRIQANTAGEAIEKMLQQKKISLKLNYDVLKSINPEDPLSESAVTKSESNIDDEITPLLMRSVKNRFKLKAPTPVPSNIKQGMSDIIGNKRFVTPIEKKSLIFICSKLC